MSVTLAMAGCCCIFLAITMRKHDKKMKKKMKEMRDERISATARAYAYRQSLIIEAEIKEEAMNKLPIYEQEVIKEIEQKLLLDNFENNWIENDIKKTNFKIMMENTPEYKEMLKKYKR